jgi:L,D-peptidoglycan transpeptidase YkuD (ErfK/YbiS/YcfS/YnhG family)
MRQGSIIRVTTKPGHRTLGWLGAGPLRVPVALGRGGIKRDKREGDGATPAGTFHPRRVWWRADRQPRPQTRLPLRAITPGDAWCEDPRDRRYNRPIRGTPGQVGDRLRRDDGLYDFIIEIDHNTRPRVAGRGSAVFLHLARPGFGATAGCIGMTHKAMILLLKMLNRRSRIVIR